MTRSVLLALHGQIGDALSLNPGGPLLVAGGLLFSAALLALTFRRLRGRDATDATPADTVLRRFILSASAYGGLTTVVLLAHWVRVIT